MTWLDPSWNQVKLPSHAKPLQHLVETAVLEGALAVVKQMGWQGRVRRPESNGTRGQDFARCACELVLEEIRATNGK